MRTPPDVSTRGRTTNRKNLQENLIMVLDLSFLQLIVFTSLNAALWKLHGDAIPTRDVAFGVIVAFVVVMVRILWPPSSEKVALTKSKLFKALFPLLSIAEFVVFLIAPWVLLSNAAREDFAFDAAYILASHLFIIQTQIALEPILALDDRRRASFRYIVGTNMYRGLGLATLIKRFIEIRPALSTESMAMTRFLDGYVVVALFVWLASNAIIAFVWRPCLRKSNVGLKGGLRTFKDAVVIITGAASGIGRALAEDLADRGAKVVVLVDRQIELAEQVAANVIEKGADAAAYEVDVRDYNEVKRVVNETKEVFGRIDYVFNNAGILIIGPIEQIGVSNFDYIFDVNVKGIHHGIQAAYPIMKEQGFGHIVNSSSLLGLIPGGQWAVAYSASKHALVGLTTNLRIEAAKYGIRVSLFCPGTIDTPIHTGGEYGKNLTGIPKDVWNKQVATMKAMDPKKCASETLDAVAENKAIIIVPERPFMWSRLLYRLSPSLWLDRAVAKVDWRRSLQNQMANADEKGKES